MKHIGDKQHDYEKEFPGWIGAVLVVASCVFSVAMVFILEVGK